MFPAGLKFYCFIILSKSEMFLKVCINYLTFKCFFNKIFLNYWALMHFVLLAYRDKEQNNNKQQTTQQVLFCPYTCSFCFICKKSFTWCPGMTALNNSLDGRHFLKRLCLTRESKEHQAYHHNCLLGRYQAPRLMPTTS